MLPLANFQNHYCSCNINCLLQPGGTIVNKHPFLPKDTGTCNLQLFPDYVLQWQVFEQLSMMKSYQGNSQYVLLGEHTVFRKQCLLRRLSFLLSGPLQLTLPHHFCCNFAPAKMHESLVTGQYLQSSTDNSKVYRNSLLSLKIKPCFWIPFQYFDLLVFTISRIPQVSCLL